LIHKNLRELAEKKKDVIEALPEADRSIVLNATKKTTPLVGLLKSLPAIIDTLPFLFVYPVPQIVGILVSLFSAIFPCCNRGAWEDSRAAVAILSNIEEVPVNNCLPLREAAFCEAFACAPCLQGQTLEHVKEEVIQAGGTPQHEECCGSGKDLCDSCKRCCGAAMGVAGPETSAGAATRFEAAGAATRFEAVGVAKDTYDGSFAGELPSSGKLSFRTPA
jgi:hypothetical protein